MIQTKFGVPSVAGRQMEVYTTAVLEASLTPPAPARHPEWRVLMEELARTSCKAYRAVRPYSHLLVMSRFPLALLTAVLEASLTPPAPARHPEWRVLMEELARTSCKAYRAVRTLECIAEACTFSAGHHDSSP